MTSPSSPPDPRWSGPADVTGAGRTRVSSRSGRAPGAPRITRWTSLPRSSRPLTPSPAAPSPVRRHPPLRVPARRGGDARAGLRAELRAGRSGAGGDGDGHERDGRRHAAGPDARRRRRDDPSVRHRCARDGHVRRPGGQGAARRRWRRAGDVRDADRRRPRRSRPVRPPAALRRRRRHRHRPRDDRRRPGDRPLRQPRRLRAPPREADYVALDAATPDRGAAPAVSPNPPSRFANCAAVRGPAGRRSMPASPGWDPKFDADGDGVGCERRP